MGKPILDMTATDREELMPFILRAARAAVAQSLVQDEGEAYITARIDTNLAGASLLDAHQELAKKRKAKLTRRRRKLGYKASDLKPKKAAT